MDIKGIYMQEFFVAGGKMNGRISKKEIFPQPRTLSFPN